MRCFNHSTNEASGVCRNCGRALCRDCIAIAEDAVACINHCEGRVAAIQRMIQGNPTSYQTAATQYRRAGINSIFAGLLFVAMGGGFFQFVRGDFGTYMGGIFAILGILIASTGIHNIKSSRKYAELADNNTEKPANNWNQ
jgi:hypothetical protein